MIVLLLLTVLDWRSSMRSAAVQSHGFALVAGFGGKVGVLLRKAPDQFGEFVGAVGATSQLHESHALGIERVGSPVIVGVLLQNRIEILDGGFVIALQGVNVSNIVLRAGGQGQVAIATQVIGIFLESKIVVAGGAVGIGV